MNAHQKCMRRYYKKNRKRLCKISLTRYYLVKNSERYKSINKKASIAYQVRQLAKGRCRVCGKFAVTKNHCQKHREIYNAWSRANYKKRSRKARRIINAQGAA